MKGSVQRSKLLPALLQALRTCKAKEGDQIEASFIFHLQEDKLVVSSLNELAEQTIEVPVDDLSWAGDESFAVNGKLLVEFLKQFPDEDIRWEYKGQDHLLELGGERESQYQFSTSVPSDYSPFPFTAVSTQAECDGRILSALFRAVGFSVAPPDFEKVICTGVHLRLEGDNIIGESTDRNRVTIYQVKSSDPISEPLSCVLPKSVADSLGEMLSGIEKVQILMGENHVRFMWEGTVLTSRILSEVDGKYPSIQAFTWPMQVGGKVKVSRQEFLRTLKLAALVAKDSTLDLEVDAKGLTITTDETRKGSTRDRVPAEVVEGGGKTTIACPYMIQAAEHTVSPWMELMLSPMPGYKDVFGLLVVDEGYRHFMAPYYKK